MSDPKYINIGRPETKLIEECSELIQALCKCERFGWDNFNPKDGVYNFDRVMSEIDDVELAIKNLKKYIGDIALTGTNEDTQLKVKKFIENMK